MRSTSYLLIVLFCALSGCRALQPEYSLFKTDHEERVDELWRQGYGYSNPNVDRMKNGQTPLNFDGSPNNFESAAKDVGERAIGNVVAFAIFEGVPAMFRGLSEKLSR